MKKLMIFLAMMMFLVSCDKETIISSGDLPDEINDYISTHFPSHTILQSIEDKDAFTKTYDVQLDGNVSLEFNRKKEIIEVESETELPSSVIPAKISHYVTENYPSNVITDWELDDNNQHVELDNGVELKFTTDGDFLSIDD
ncbi:PepSY-like domain-containing protein [Brumimicrobium aurantiacum]|uniref:Putative beta-lactamase-inhibitor-like PepSY-like domain-containing protein n=1 Tax=Brumimicrobium aurantiacum TaxID=1737063 RepID=A0A3E1F209_9FLAO|nr:PepSY-like domain-containing protein [Brumimicrobium aurantiacum]RFC55846.1 hypothetical protein DXU93_02600 [Brumimicrobium aurantiacum]